MKKLLSLFFIIAITGCGTIGGQTGSKAQTGLSDFVTGDTITAAKLNAIKNTADTADAQATTNDGRIDTIEALTGLVFSDADGTFTELAAITSTEVGYLDGVTSAIQTQLDGKQSTLTNEAGLYAALSDVTQFYESGDEDTIAAAITAGAYTDDSVQDDDIDWDDISSVVKKTDTILIAEAVIANLAASMDNYGIFTADKAYTITSVGVRCEGTCTLAATITLQDGAGNAMTITGTNPTVQTSDSGAVTFANVTAGGGIVEGELVEIDVTNAVNPETDKYYIILRGTTN